MDGFNEFKCRSCGSVFTILGDPEDANFKCPECGESSQSRVYECENCGIKALVIPIERSKRKIRDCPECGGRLREVN